MAVSGYLHGVYTAEIPTAIVPPTRLAAGIPVVFGTAPLHLTGNFENVNKPVLCYSYAEAVEALGYSDDWEKFTLCEFMYSEFMLYKCAPVVFVNVLDPAKHFEKVAAKEFAIDADGQVDLGLDVIASSVKVTSVNYTPASSHEVAVAVTTDYTVSTSPLDGHSFLKVVSGGGLDGVEKVIIAFDKNDGTHVDAAEYEFDASGNVDLGEDVNLNSIVATKTVETPASGAEYALADDFILTYDDDGKCWLSVAPDGALENVRDISIEFSKIDASKVTHNDIIGGINSRGDATGIALTEEVYPKFGVIPGLLAAPGWSDDSAVAAVLSAYCDDINSIFTAKCVVDVPTDECDAYTKVVEWKNKNNYVKTNMAVCWPLVKLGDRVFHLSTQLIGIMNKTDSEDGGGYPYISPSNHSIQADGAVLANGKEINLGLTQADYLNGQGIITALNFIGGWRAWGNRTGCYPSNTDPKDAFLCVTRMFAHIRNTFITTFWQEIDAPLNKRLIKKVVNSFNYFLDGLTAAEIILGGRVEFLSDENAITDLIDGIVHFHVYMTPTVPAKEIHANFEFDTDYFNTLFDEV